VLSLLTICPQLPSLSPGRSNLSFHRRASHFSPSPQFTQTSYLDDVILILYSRDRYIFLFSTPLGFDRTAFLTFFSFSPFVLSFRLCTNLPSQGLSLPSFERHLLLFVSLSQSYTMAPFAFKPVYLFLALVVLPQVLAGPGCAYRNRGKPDCVEKCKNHWGYGDNCMGAFSCSTRLGNR